MVAAVPFLLAVFGDLRNVVSPLGYWVLWMAGSVTLLFAASPSFVFHFDDQARKDGIFGAAFLFFLLLGIFFSSAAAGTYGGVYAWLKFAVLFVMGFIIIAGFRQLSKGSVYRVAEASVYLVLIVFLASKFELRQFYIELGDGRQGLLFAYPGVMWKAGAFCYPIFVLYFIFEEQRLRVVAAAIAALIIILLDGSRTGLLWIAFATLSCAAIWLASSRRLISIVAGAYAIASAAVAVLVLYLYLPPLAVMRLMEGDPVRHKMIIDGANKIADSFPFGGGVGTTVSRIGDGEMIVHNAYLQAVGDMGAFGAFSIVTLFVWLISIYGAELAAVGRRDRFLYFSSLLGVSCFLFLMMLHPLSTEMSEWGWFFLMFSLVHSVHLRPVP